MKLSPLTCGLFVALLAAGATTASAQAPAAPPVLSIESSTELSTGLSTEPASGQVIDGIAAIVDKDVITLRELRQRSDQVRAELARQHIAPPADAILQRQVLQRLISERVEDHEATRMNVRISDAQVNAAIETIAARNNISVAQMRQQIETSSTWAEYRRTLYRDLLHDRMRQLAVDHTLMVSDAEVDAYLQEQAAQRTSQAAGQAAGPELLTLAQILVRVPEGASSDQVAELRLKAQQLWSHARANTDFAALAAATSDGSEALEGGALGARPVDGWPELFTDAIGSQGAGYVSDIIQSGNGFHILKVLERARAGAGTASAQATDTPAPVPVTQTHARHILIKTSAVVSDDQARQRLEQLRQRITAGESFADLARRFSSDASAPQGGDLGWVNPGETVPAFAEAMDALAEGEVSIPVKSQFGWHLITVEARRVQDMAQELLRMQARQTIFERRAQPAFENWLAQLHDQAYIDNRLEKRQQLEQSL